MYRIAKELSNPIFFFSIFYFVLFGLFKLSLSFVLRFFVYSYHSRVITSVAVIYSLSFLRNPIERKNCNLLYNFPFPPLFPFFSFFILLFFFFFSFIFLFVFHFYKPLFIHFRVYDYAWPIYSTSLWYALTCYSMMCNASKSITCPIDRRAPESKTIILDGWFLLSCLFLLPPSFSYLLFYGA